MSLAWPFLTLSPMTKRRWRAFQSNRRGYWSLWIFIVFLLISSCANLIANKKPLLVYFEGQLHCPLLEFISDKEMGGRLPVVCAFHQQRIQDRIKEKGGIMVWPLIPFDSQPVDASGNAAPSPPDGTHYLGTDDQGRDVLARVIYGFRLSAYFGLFLAFFSITFGVFFGAIQGYLGGRVDLILQRMTEIWSGLPVLYLLIILSSFVSPNFWWLMLIMSLFSWMSLSNLVRAEFLRGRQLDYVRAAQALGVSTFSIIWRHVLPNAMVAVVTFLPFLLNHGISYLTSLDFLGFGFPPGTASLGELLSQGKNNLHAPWLGMTSFLVMSLLLSLLIFIGEGIRDAFDPSQESFGRHSKSKLSRKKKKVVS